MLYTVYGLLNVMYECITITISIKSLLHDLMPEDAILRWAYYSTHLSWLDMLLFCKDVFEITLFELYHIWNCANMNWYISPYLQERNKSGIG